MAVCGSLRSLLDSPMPPESQILVEPLSSSWNQIHPIKPPIEAASVAAEIFRELYFREKRSTVVELEPPSVDVNGQVHVDKYQKLDFSLGGYPSKSHEPLHMCTEGLGSESSDDVDDLIMTENEGEGRPQSSTAKYGGDKYGCTRNAKSWAKSAGGGRVFPPPISSIGKGGRPWVAGCASGLIGRTAGSSCERRGSPVGSYCTLRARTGGLSYILYIRIKKKPSQKKKKKKKLLYIRLNLGLYIYIYSGCIHGNGHNIVNRSCV